MKTLLLLLSALLLLRASASAADAAKGFERYAFVRTRNVFDPDRKAVTVVQTTTVKTTTSSRPSAVTLTGTMATGGKSLAFFASARAEYNKVIPVNDSVAGFKVKSISAGIIEIEHEGKSQVLSVGDSLPIPGAVAGEPEPPAPDPTAAPAVAGAPAAPASPAAAAPAPGGADDVLKRMLERRQKEMTR